MQKDTMLEGLTTCTWESRYTFLRRVHQKTK